MTTKISSMLMGAVLLLCAGFVNAEDQTTAKQPMVLSASEMDSVSAGSYYYYYYYVFPAHVAQSKAKAEAYGYFTDTYTGTYAKTTPHSSKSGSYSSAITF